MHIKFKATMSNKFDDLVVKKPIKRLKAKRNAAITNISLIIESIGKLQVEKARVKLLQNEKGFAETELNIFLDSNMAFVGVLMQEDAEINQLEKFKADQNIVKENVKSLKMLISIKEKELVKARFIDLDIKPPSVHDSQLADLIESLESNNDANTLVSKENAEAIKVLAATTTTSAQDNADAIKILIATTADVNNANAPMSNANADVIKTLAATTGDAGEKQKLAIEKLANIGKGPRMIQPEFTSQENCNVYINFKSFFCKV